MLVVPAVLDAQRVPSYDGSGQFSSGNGPTCRSAVNLAARSQWRGASMSLLPAPLSRETGYGVGTPVMAFGIRTSEQRQWRVEASGAIGHSDNNCAALSEWPRQYLQIARESPGRGVAMSLGGRSLSDMDPSRDRQGITVTAWQKLRSARLFLDVRSHGAQANELRVRDIIVYRNAHDSLNPRDTGIATPFHVSDTSLAKTRVRAVDVRTRVQFAVGRLALDFTAGGTVGRGFGLARADTRDTTLGASPSSTHVSPLRIQVWGRADARLPLASFLDVTLGLAALPTQPVLGSSFHGVVSLGFGLSRWSRVSTPSIALASSAMAFKIVREDSASVLFRFFAKGAKSVQLSGEPMQWLPVAMRNVSGDWWEAVVVAGPGTYRMNISIDGAPWAPPPGVPAVRDEFGGHVGLVTVH